MVVLQMKRGGGALPGLGRPRGCGRAALQSALDLNSHPCVFGVGTPSPRVFLSVLYLVVCRLWILSVSRIVRRPQYVK